MKKIKKYYIIKKLEKYVIKHRFKIMNLIYIIMSSFIYFIDIKLMILAFVLYFYNKLLIRKNKI